MTANGGNVRTLVVTPVYAPFRAGEAEYALHFCRHLASRVGEIDVLHNRGIQGVRSPKIHLHPVMPSWTWRDVPRLFAFFRRRRPAEVYFLYIGWMYDRHPMATYLPLFLKLWCPDTRVTTLFYNRIGAEKARNSWVVRALRKLASVFSGGADSGYEFGTLLASSDRLVFLADKHRKFLESVDLRTGPKAITLPALPCLEIFPRATDGRREGRRLFGIEEGEFVFCFFGFLYPSKNLESLLEAFALLVEHRAERRMRLVIAGDSPDEAVPDAQGYSASLRRLADRLGVTEKVVWAGGFPSESHRGSWILHASDACVLPFAVGIALNNSSVAAVAAHGVPIVSTLPQTLESDFVPGENVLLAPPGDSKALEREMEKLLDDPGLRARLRAGSLRLADTAFSWDRALDALVGEEKKQAVR